MTESYIPDTEPKSSYCIYHPDVKHLPKRQTICLISRDTNRDEMKIKHA